MYYLYMTPFSDSIFKGKEWIQSCQSLELGLRSQALSKTKTGCHFFHRLSICNPRSEHTSWITYFTLKHLFMRPCQTDVWYWSHFAWSRYCVFLLNDGKLDLGEDTNSSSSLQPDCWTIKTFAMAISITALLVQPSCNPKSTTIQADANQSEKSWMTFWLLP